MIGFYRCLCFFVAAFYVVIGGKLFFPGNAIPWLCYALVLVLVEIFVLGLVQPPRWRKPGVGSFDVVGGHAVLALACGAFCWPSWDYATLSLVTILAAQFMPGPRTKAFVFGAASAASGALGLSSIPGVGAHPLPEYGWVYQCVCFGVMTVLIGAVALGPEARKM